MTGPNLTRALASFRSTGRMWAVDRESGAVHSLPLELFALVEGTPEVSIYKFFPESWRAYAEQARVLAGIARRN